LPPTSIPMRFSVSFRGENILTTDN
jgi:hypothetical protein